MVPSLISLSGLRGFRLTFLMRIHINVSGITELTSEKPVEMEHGANHGDNDSVGSVELRTMSDTGGTESNRG